MVLISVIDQRSPQYQAINQEISEIVHQHRENFARWLWFFSKPIQRDLMILYSFCRYADNLADCSLSPEERLKRLEDFEQNFLSVNSITPKPLFLIAVEDLIQRRNLPREEFLSLLTAFKQDQLVWNWESLQALLQYSENSANPVGRLVLGILQPNLLKPPYIEASNHICTALQLVNFWQDVARDFENHRVYLPQDYREKYQVTLEQLEQRQATESFRLMMKELCDFTEKKFITGRQVFRNLNGAIGFFIDWFAVSGLLLLKEIRKQNYDTLTRRPKLGTYRRIQSIFQCLLRI